MKYTRLFQIAIALSNIFFSAAVLMVGGIYLGRYLDALLKTNPLFTIALSILGLLLSFYSMIKILMKLNK